MSCFNNRTIPSDVSHRRTDLSHGQVQKMSDKVKAKLLKHRWPGNVRELRNPNIRNGQLVGYTSVRRKPSRSKIEESEALYKTLIAEE